MKLTIGESELGCMQTVVPAFPARRVLSLHQKRPTPLRVSRVTPRHRSLICVMLCVCHSMLYTLQDRPGCCSEGLVGVVRREGVRAAHSCLYEWCKGARCHVMQPCTTPHRCFPALSISVTSARRPVTWLDSVLLDCRKPFPTTKRQQGMCRCIGAHI